MSTRGLWILAVPIAIYALCIGLVLHPWVQKHALYAHKVHTLWWQDVDIPEAWGFAPGQVSPFWIHGQNGQKLYAWHVVPLGQYADHAADLIGQETKRSYGKQQGQMLGLGPVSRELLRDPRNRLVINFHGNAGHVAQGWRTDALKAVSAADSEYYTHVVTFDYRGFGKSPGDPSEAGLIEDGVTVLDWAAQVVQDPKTQIIVLGHSLGTAVATAAIAAKYDHDTQKEDKFPLAGLLLSGGFTNVPQLLETYLTCPLHAIAGLIPVLSPLRAFPRFQQVLASHVVDIWQTSVRLKSLVQRFNDARIQILHASDDRDIRSIHADMLFDAALGGLQYDASLRVQKFNIGSTKVKLLDPVESKRVARVMKRTWIRRDVLQYGGHNRALASADTPLAIGRLFGIARR